MSLPVYKAIVIPLSYLHTTIVRKKDIVKPRLFILSVFLGQPAPVKRAG